MLGALLFLAAATADPAAAKTCLVVGRQLDYAVADENTLLIRAGGKRWRSALPGGCPGLAPNMILVRREASPRVCANDLFEVKDNFTPQVFGLCRFGPFVPLGGETR